MELFTLNVKRVKETQGLYKGFNKTQFYKQDGTLIATLPASQKQIRKDTKTYTLNCWKYNLNWLK